MEEQVTLLKIYKLSKTLRVLKILGRVRNPET